MQKYKQDIWLRIWTNKVLKDCDLKGCTVNLRSSAQQYVGLGQWGKVLGRMVRRQAGLTFVFLLLLVALPRDVSSQEGKSVLCGALSGESYLPDSLLKPEGKLPGLFSISDSTQVQFSMGNLQYQLNTEIWCFANNQYDVLSHKKKWWRDSHYWREDPTPDPSDFSWMDDFAWASSGYERPTDEVGSNKPYRRKCLNLGGAVVFCKGKNANFDWGIYNKISNGGDKAGLWRTLSDTEWMYLLTERPHANELRSRAMVCGVEGYLLLPDDFQLPMGLSFTPRSKDYQTNQYDSEEDWRRMETAGALFLPESNEGIYWTSRGGMDRSAVLSFDSEQVSINYNYFMGFRGRFHNVRLVSTSTVKKKDRNRFAQHKKPQRKPKEVEGALEGGFSVSDSSQVRFSKGNLQYQATTDTWRFATNQYDAMGLDYSALGLENDSALASYPGWVDLFLWATSGYDDNRKPTMYHNDYDFQISNDPSGFDDPCCANYDWGVYNRIENGGCEKGLWRTLTREEWHYLLEGRPNANNLRSRARVCGVSGYMILPDDFTLPEGLTFLPRCYDFFFNDYDGTQWKQMETAGALFLPSTNYCPYTHIEQFGSYWTSSSSLCSRAYCFSFENWSYMQVNHGMPIEMEEKDCYLFFPSIYYFRASVRLVTDQ